MRLTCFESGQKPHKNRPKNGPEIPQNPKPSWRPQKVPSRPESGWIYPIFAMVETLLASDWGFSLHRVKDFLRVAKNPIKIAPKMAPKSHGTQSHHGGSRRFRLDPNPVGFTPFLPWLGPFKCGFPLGSVGFPLGFWGSLWVLLGSHWVFGVPIGFCGVLLGSH